MKKSLVYSLALALAIGSPAMAGELSAVEREALAGQSCSDLAALRAGAADDVNAIAAAERGVLTLAMAAAPDLESLRAGDDIDDDDLALVAVVLGIVILAIIIF